MNKVTVPDLANLEWLAVFGAEKCMQYFNPTPYFEQIGPLHEMSYKACKRSVRTIEQTAPQDTGGR